METSVKLTQFSHGGGCGCKISPSILSKILADSPVRQMPAQLLVGIESSDDAAVYQLNERQAIIATTDFFTPIVDNPFHFGQIAATNALSDVYAMGGQPIFALAILGMPLDKLPVAVIQEIIAGGESICARAGIPIAGGHSIDTLEPIYGLVAMGTVHPSNVKRNNQAKAGDVLVLGKPLGVGILSAALKKGRLSDVGYAQMLASTTQLNTPGTALANISGVHAITDVTGFGLAGHLLEICRGSKLSAKLKFTDLPILSDAEIFAKDGIATGASQRNWDSYAADVHIDNSYPLWQRNVFTDPQTSGGLLVACAPESINEVLAIFADQGFPHARVIGELMQGPAELHIA
jgi:selenide, water dikinase